MKGHRKWAHQQVAKAMGHKDRADVRRQHIVNATGDQALQPKIDIDVFPSTSHQAGAHHKAYTPAKCSHDWQHAIHKVSMRHHLCSKGLKVAAVREAVHVWPGHARL
jgi:hypothetical protein